LVEKEKKSRTSAEKMRRRRTVLRAKVVGPAQQARRNGARRG
jgi:hypothetical protein